MDELRRRILNYFKQQNRKREKILSNNSQSEMTVQNRSKQVNKQKKESCFTSYFQQIQNKQKEHNKQKKTGTLYDYFSPIISFTQKSVIGETSVAQTSAQKVDLQKTIKQGRGIEQAQIRVKSELLQLSFQTGIQGKKERVWISSKEITNVNPLWLLNFYLQYF